MTLLALDLSTRCGWTHDRQSGGAPFFGTERLPRVESDQDGDDFRQTYVAFWRFLEGKIAVVRPTHILFEAPLPDLKPRDDEKRRKTPAWVVRMLLGLSTLTETIAALKEIPCNEVMVATVRKHFTGYGRAQKRDVMRQCHLLGWNVQNDNEGDAAALWSYGKSTLDPAFAYRTTPIFGRASA